jgi:hypothetical protein
MGFQFAETMSGLFAPADHPEDKRLFAFDLHLSAPSTWRYLRDGRLRMTGMVEAEGLAERAPLEGTMTLRPWKLIRYEFEFPGDDGRRYRFRGQKDIRWRDPLHSFTELPGAVYDEGDTQVGSCLVEFDTASDWFQFLTSWKRA